MGVSCDLLFFYFYVIFYGEQLTDLKQIAKYRAIKGTYTHGAMITLYNNRHAKMYHCKHAIHLWSLYAQSHNIIFIMPFYYLRSSLKVSFVVKKCMPNAEN